MTLRAGPRRRAESGHEPSHESLAPARHGHESDHDLKAYNLKSSVLPPGIIIMIVVT